MVDPELKKNVKEALKEIERDKDHAEVHRIINQRMHEQTPLGQASVTKCGICNKLLTYENYDIGLMR